MMRTLLVTTPLILVLACTGADTTTEEVPVPEPPVTSMDPVVVGPTVYSTVFENDQIRVNKVSFDPGEEIAMHSHPDHAIYALSGGKLDITGPDGTVNHVELATGQATFMPASSHSAKNVGDTLVEAAQVEIKAPTGASAPAGTDPAVAGPTIYKLVYENERVRIFETTFAAGAEIPMHSHPDHVAYVLKGGKLAITSAAVGDVDGKISEIELADGQAAYLPAESHSAKNIGDTELKLVVYEIKAPAPAVAGP